jgi:hypothetical protein
MKWVLGYSEESCSLTCTRVAATCQISYLNNIVTQDAFYSMVASSMQVGTSTVPGAATTFCNLGINVYTFAATPAAFTYQVYNVDGFTLQTFCNYPTSVANLQTTCDARYSYPPSRRFCPCVMQSCGNVVEVPIPEPTAAPSAAPTTRPSVSHIDCTVSCSFLTDSPLAVTPGYLYQTISVSTYFKVQFDYYNPTIGSYPVISNILDLVNAVTGESLLSVSLPWTTNTVLGYDGNVLQQWGPNLVGNYQSAWTTITVVVKAGSVSITSSSNPGWIATTTVAVNVDTTLNYYKLYLSNPTVDNTHNCAGGSIKNLVITGTSNSFPRIVHYSHADIPLPLSSQSS